MLKLSKTYLPLLATASLLTLAACSTIDEEIPAPPSEEPAAVLNLNILAPHTISTRAEDREVAATDNENMLHDIRVWAYKSSTAADRDNDLPVGYAEVANAQNIPTTDSPYVLTMLLPESMYANADKTALFPMDFYVMANTNQLNTLTAMPEMPTRKALREASFGHVETNDNYGLSGTPVTTASATTGLPISQIKTNVTVNPNPSGQNLLYKNEEPIVLTRAISKIQFYFTKANGMTDVEVTKIEINGSAFPTTQYIFPVEKTTGLGDVTVANLPRNASNEVARETAKITYENATTPITIKELTQTQDPDMFKWDSANETAQQYVDKITNNPDNTRNVTLCCTTYLRETDGNTAKDDNDHTIMGTIYYRIGTESYSKTFALLNENDFVRNHQWFIYGYFNGGKLEVKPIVLKWDWEDDHDYEYESKGPIEISIFGDAGKQSYKMFNPTPNSTGSPINWNNAYVGIYYGVETDPEEPLGMPLYSPMLHLSTAYKQDLTLYSSNPAFGFITMTMVPKTDENPFGRAYSEPMASVTIPKYTGTSDYPNKSEYTDTYFYVVPMTEQADIPTIDNNNLPAERITHVYLLDPDGYKQPINPSFMPGPNNIEIWFFYMNSLNAYQELDDYEG